MRLTSSQFESSAMIPRKYTCDGEDISPPLRLDEVPADTKSVALIVEDPDAPSGNWVHWLVCDMTPQAEIPEGGTPGKQLTNSFSRTGYGGPCPPSGTHRYYFRAYALDVPTLEVKAEDGREELGAAMKGHVIAEAELMGRYGR